MTQHEAWAVILRDTGEVYGPMDEVTARSFAEFLSEEIDPAEVRRMRSPAGEVLAWWGRRKVAEHRERVDIMERTAGWPPQPGDIWQDTRGYRWVCVPRSDQKVGEPPRGGYLVCLAEFADDSAEEIFRVHGPLRLVYRAGAREEEAPF